jgi:sulfonate transport system substrate-binding protein
MPSHSAPSSSTSSAADRRLSVPARRRLRTPALVMGLALVAGLVAVGGVTRASASTTKATLDLSGVTLNVADQFKEYETAFAATGTLTGAPYKVNWSQFVGGPPIIAAETGGSVDLGDMAETPTVFAQAAGDPVKVVAITKAAVPTSSPYSIVVPPGSSITKLSQLKGHTIAVQVGTVEQYFLIQALAQAGVSYSAVTIDNLPVTSGATALASGKVDAFVSVQPLTALNVLAGKARVVKTGAGIVQTLGYLTASQAALDNPAKTAAIADFVNRFYKAEAILAKNPNLAAQTYVKTFGVSLAAAKQAVASVQAVGTPVTPTIVAYQQREANTFLKLGLITSKLNVNQVFDKPLNQKISTAAGLKA